MLPTRRAVLHLDIGKMLPALRDSFQQRIALVTVDGQDHRTACEKTKIVLRIVQQDLGVLRHVRSVVLHFPLSALAGLLVVVVEVVRRQGKQG
ncbi:hypothetical protein BH09PSE5_BH09PSE5_35940 [soil metagenome]